ncbi:glycosyltransferase [Acidianus manzaensis]|uniref:glycosyltransferase n=1 Tax=Acidianus manzaensis TaxID=282676 RepID=UPI00164F11CE|nr:glycosyltransferase family 2 protein [Acidianus manzaensis]
MILSSIISSSWLLLQVYYLKSIKNGLEIEKKEEDKEPFFSIIVAIKNEDQKIVKELISNLIALDYDKYEVIIVSDDPKEYVSNIISSTGVSWNNIKIVRRERPIGRKAGALNYATKLANGEYFIFLDSEARVNKDFLRKICKYLDKEPLALHVEIRNHENFIEKIYSETTNFAMKSLFLSRFQKGLYIFPNGSAIVISRDTLSKIGFWKEGIVTEDLELGIRAALKGKQFTYVHDILVSLLSPRALFDLYYQIERWAYGSGELFIYGLKLFSKGFKGVEGYIYVIQWGIYSVFIFVLAIVASLQMLLHLSMSTYIISILIFSISLLIYSSSFKISEDEAYLVSIATIWAAIIGFTKGLFKLNFSWKVTPKIRSNTSKPLVLRVLQYIFFIIALTNLIYNNIFSSLILLLLSISIFIIDT